MSTLRLCVIGAGWIGRKHAERIIASDECELAAICDLAPERKAVADELGVCWDCDLTAMLDREQPDGVVIATPNGSHVTIAETCARHSTHLLVEKPIADTIEEALRVNRAAEAAGVQVLVGHHRRHNPLIRETRDVVQGGALGRLVAISAHWMLTKPANYYDVTWRTKRPGGGPMLINLIHELDSLRFICGEIDQVYALASSAVRGFEVEDSLSMTLSFANGVVGSVLASDTAATPWSYEATTGENPHYFHADENCYHFAGTHGALAFPRMDMWQYADEGRRGWQHPMQTTHRHVEGDDPLARQLAHFCRVIRGEETAIAGGRDAARSLAVALAALESMESHQPATVPAIPA